MHLGTAEAVQWSKSTSGKIQDGGWRQNWPCLNGYNSAADRPISLKFCGLVQNGVPGATKWSGCTTMKFKTGGGHPNIFRLYRNNTSANRWIFTKLGTYAGNGFHTMRNGQHIWPRVGYPRSNFVWGHPKLFGVIRGNSAAIRGNSAADERIFTKFGVCIWTMGHRKLRYGQRAPHVKFKIGENPQTFFRLYRNHSAENRWIFTKHGTYAGNLIPDVVQCSEWPDTAQIYGGATLP